MRSLNRERPPAGLFPPVEPRRSGMLDVGGGHTIYWEESGNPQGIPVAYLHGGPGAGTAPAYRRFFDPSFWRIVLFDQRGAGRSRPYASLRDNTTQDLVADIERLRLHLGIDRWLLFGGSWGSTLALAYGEAHRQRCLGMVLRGVFLFRPQEVEWFVSGMGLFFPEAARRFVDFLPPPERCEPLRAYHRRLTDPDPAVHGPAARAWCAYEEACSRLIPPQPATPPGPGASADGLAMARLEAHYMVNQGFLARDQLLAEAPRLAGLPAIIVQGRYDVICPPSSACDLARAWPGAELRMIPDGGHAAMDPGIRDALVAAVDHIADRL